MYTIRIIDVFSAKKRDLLIEEVRATLLPEPPGLQKNNGFHFPRASLLQLKQESFASRCETLLL